MTRTINPLSPEALERLQAGPEGTNVASLEPQTPWSPLGTAPPLVGDPRARQCVTHGVLLYPGEVCAHCLDAADPEPLPGVAGWEGAPIGTCSNNQWGSTPHHRTGLCEDWRPIEPLSATVDCGTCGYRVATGECCPRCDANCSLPASPANEEETR